MRSLVVTVFFVVLGALLMAAHVHASEGSDGMNTMHKGYSSGVPDVEPEEWDFLDDEGQAEDLDDPQGVCRLAGVILKVAKPCRREGQAAVEAFLSRDMPRLPEMFEVGRDTTCTWNDVSQLCAHMYTYTRTSI